MASGLDSLIAGFSNIGLLGFIFLFGLSLVSYLIRFLRWNFLLATQAPLPPLKEHLLIYFAGFSLTMTPAKAGEAIRSAYLKNLGVPYSASLSTLVSERFLDLAATAFFVLCGAFLFPKAEMLACAALPLLILLFFLLRSHIDTFAKILLKKESSFQEAFKEQLSPKNFLIGLSLGMLAWFLEGLSLFIILKMLGEEIPLIQAVFSHAFALLVGALTFLPGGVGGTEGALLEALTFFRSSLGNAATATILIRLFTLWFSIILGFGCLPILKKPAIQKT